MPTPPIAIVGITGVGKTSLGLEQYGLLIKTAAGATRQDIRRCAFARQSGIKWRFFAPGGSPLRMSSH
jgi:hypothetical protein